MLIWMGKQRLGQRDPDKEKDVVITKEAMLDFMDQTRNPIAKQEEPIVPHPPKTEF